MLAAGRVFVIRCEPDPFTGERFNVGVCVQERATGKRYVRCITDPGRLDCLYGTQANTIVRMAKMAAAYAGEGKRSPSSQIIFDKAKPYYNASAEEILDITFRSQVTVALPRREDSPRARIDDQAAFKLVLDALRLRLPLHELAEVVANTPDTLVNTPKGPRSVHVHFQPRNGVGVLRSLDYSAPSLRTHLMDSVLDLQCAAYYRKRGHQALFVLRPSYESDGDAALRDDVLDSIGYRAPELEISQANDSGDLAAQITQWAATAA